MIKVKVIVSDKQKELDYSAHEIVTIIGVYRCIDTHCDSRIIVYETRKAIFLNSQGLLEEFYPRNWSNNRFVKTGEEIEITFKHC